jgi:hypothetical protein
MSTTEECKLGQTLEDTGYLGLSTWNLRVGHDVCALIMTSGISDKPKIAIQ